MSRVEVDKIQQQCGSTLTVGGGASKTVAVDATTVTLGRCGGTVTLASGATQSGFGRTGTVNWDTSSIKTATFTAVAGNGYFCNTAGGTFEVDLPAGTAGDIVSVQDYNNTFDSNALTIDPNGSEKINGGVAGGHITLNTEGEGVTLVYVDSTVGWRSVQDNEFSDAATNFITATGGTIITCGDYKTHIFTGPGTFTVTSAGSACGSNSVEHLVVAGGGGGGKGSGAGAGGAGGYRQNYPSPTTGGTPVLMQAYPITVGAGATSPCASPYAAPGCRVGSNSIFSSITSNGGGGGGSEGPAGSLTLGGNGGSGGGGAYGPGSPAGGGSGNTPPTSPSQGNNGGAGGGSYGGGGGGGASAVGACAPGGSGGAGGAGTPIADVFIGTPAAPSYGTPGPSPGRYFSGGGGGGGQNPGPTFGPGGSGGGGRGGYYPGPTPGTAGTANTGGGGGGGVGTHPSPAANGGSGIVMIRYKFQ